MSGGLGGHISQEDWERGVGQDDDVHRDSHGLGGHISQEDIDEMERERAMPCKKCGKTGDAWKIDGYCKPCYNVVWWDDLTIKELKWGIDILQRRLNYLTYPLQPDPEYAKEIPRVKAELDKLKEVLVCKTAGGAIKIYDDVPEILPIKFLKKDR